MTLNCRTSRFTPRSLALSLTTLAVVGLSGCSAMDSVFKGDKVDYRSNSNRTTPLEVPPDLTQLQREGRYAPQNTGPVSANAYQSAAPVASATATSAAQAAIAPTVAGDFRLMRNGNQRWLVTSAPAEQVWPRVRAFWEERGFTLTTDSPESGTLETNWAENRAKIDDGIVRRTLGRVFESFYSTGERDKFRTRIERNTASNTTEIYVTHFGMQEVYTSQLQDQTRWTSRPNDPQLEADFMQRMMVRLGAKPDDAKAVMTAGAAPAVLGGAAVASSTPARARILEGQATATLQLDENLDRAWRRVGIALDRNGFTVEDRDRSIGTYNVRYADPRSAGKDEPGFLSRLFGASSTNLAPGQYRVKVTADGERSRVAVYDTKDTPQNNEIGQRIINLLLEELR